MNNYWFECGIRYEKMQENGIAKKVTEQYIVPAMSFTEAEARIIEEISAYIDGEFVISTIKRANYTEIFFTDDSEAGYWFKCKVNFITLNESTGAEKKTGCYILVQATSTEDANSKLHEGMKGIMSDYQIASVSETSIYDVFTSKAE